MFVFALTFPGVVYQPYSGMPVSAEHVADVDRWLRRVCRVGRLLRHISLFTASCADITFSPPLLIPAFTTDLQCPRSSAAHTLGVQSQ